jgi:hypothetical protein
MDHLYRGEMDQGFLMYFSFQICLHFIFGRKVRQMIHQILITTKKQPTMWKTWSQEKILIISLLFIPVQLSSPHWSISPTQWRRDGLLHIRIYYFFLRMFKRMDLCFVTFISRLKLCIILNKFYILNFLKYNNFAVHFLKSGPSLPHLPYS